jgi:amino acid adenylation domain-containing protein
MSELSELLAAIRVRGVRLFVQDGVLRYEGPEGAMDESLKVRIRRFRSELSRLLEMDRQRYDPTSSNEGGRNRWPASEQQIAIWTAEHLEDVGATFHIAFALHLSGVLQIESLRDALNTLLRRHDVLRTRLVASNDGRSVAVEQLVDPHRELPLEVQRLEGRDAEEHVRRFIQRKFDLEREIPVRWILFDFGQERHQLVVVIHHVAVDGWSLSILVKELIGRYRDGHDPQPPRQAAALPYRHYAVLQAERSSNSATESDLRYWRHVLSGANGSLGLNSRSPKLGSRPGRWLRVKVESDLVARLWALATSCECALFPVLVSAFALVLSRTTGNKDITFGIPAANRPLPELVEAIGMFVNPVMLRVTLDDDPTFKTLIRRCAENAREALSHQEAPFQQVVAALRSEAGDADGSAPFDVMFAYQESEPLDLSLPGLDASLEELSTETAKYALTLDLRNCSGELSGWIEYATDALDERGAEHLASRFQAALLAAVDRPDARTSEFEVLSAQELSGIRASEVGSRAAPAADDLWTLLRRAVAHWAERVAVEPVNERLYFRDIESQSASIAASLHSIGVRPGTIVAVLSCRRPSLVSALLGILRAGATYLPLEPTHPAARLIEVVEASGVTVALVDGEGAACLGGVPGLRLLRIPEALAGGSRPSLQPQLSPRQLAYVLATSGSSGRPKIVGVTHGNAANFVEWARGYYSSDEFAGVWAGTSLTFDLSIFELFVTLCAGGTILLTETPFDLPLGATQPILVNTVPSVLRELVVQGKIPASVRTINSAGEVLSIELARELWAKTSIRRLVNLYGPTEVTTYATASEVTRDASSVAIGRPILNTWARVLDDGGRRVGSMVEGELYLGGEGVSQGYALDARASAERFVPDPFADGQRLYRTGDFVYRHWDGDLHFVGRRDDQIKRNGHRIELAEIESVIRRDAAIRDVAVLWHNAGSRAQLVAFIVLQPGATRSESELRAQVEKRLPMAMVPNRFCAVGELPRTTNNKLSRPELERKATSLVAAESSGRAPVGDVEVTIAGIWRNCLGCNQVLVDQNFFELGGNSLAAVQVAHRLEVEFGISFSGTEVFKHPTVARSASFVRERLADISQLEALVEEVAGLSDADVSALLGSELQSRGSESEE